jgi:DNA polymerase-1
LPILCVETSKGIVRPGLEKSGKSLNYGMSDELLAVKIGKSVQAAAELRVAYMARYPAVSAFFRAAVEQTRQTLRSCTILGRRRLLPDVLSSNNGLRRRAERQAVNNNIQGGAADVVRLAMTHIDHTEIWNIYGARMLLQVHDELVFEVPEDNAQLLIDTYVRERMEHPFARDLVVPLTVSAGIGDSWGTAK